MGVSCHAHPRPQCAVSDIADGATSARQGRISRAVGQGQGCSDQLEGRPLPVISNAGAPRNFFSRLFVVFVCFLRYIGLSSIISRNLLASA